MTDKPEVPAHEPEIIPPDRSGRRPPGNGPDMRVFVDYGGGGGERVHVVRLGPLGGALLGLAIAVVVAFFLLLLVGALVIWIPLVALVIGAAVISGLMRTYFRRGGRS